MAPGHCSVYRPLVLPDLDAWDAWHPRVLADRLAGVDFPWYVAAGWALDLFRGTQTRPHDDIEIAVPADRFDQVAYRFGDCDFHVALDGRLWPATTEALGLGHQTWARERETGKWRFDVFREPHDGEVWTYRRDRRIRRPYREIVELGTDRIPYLAPEVVLLFKSRGSRAKDGADFHAVLPLLHPYRRQWLDSALALVSPSHSWRAAIADSLRT